MSTKVNPIGKSSKNFIYKISLTPESPISIGNGKSISPLSDYYFDANKNKLYLINRANFEALLLNNPEIIEDFILKVQNTTERKNEFLLRFLMDKLEVSEEQVLSDYFYPNAFKAIGIEKSTEISSIVKNGNQPYIPGSSIKGAIKTAMLFSWLEAFKMEQLTNILKSSHKIYQKHIKDIVDKDQILKKNTLSKAEEKKLEGIQKKINDSFKRVKYELNDLLDEFLEYGDVVRRNRKREEKRMVFNKLQLSDVELLNLEDIEFQLIQRYHLKTGNLDIPICREVISKDASSSSFELRVENTFMNRRPFNWKQNDRLGEIFKCINRFSRAVASYEVAMLENESRSKKLLAESSTSALYKRYLEFINGIFNKCNPEETNQSYINIGFGKSYYANSIGILLFDIAESDEFYSEYPNDNLFMEFISLAEMGAPDQEEFPITKALNPHGLPLGWVKLELQNDNEDD